MFTIKCGVVNKILRQNLIQSLLKMCFLWCLFFNLHLTKHQSNIGVPSRKVPE